GPVGGVLDVGDRPFHVDTVACHHLDALAGQDVDLIQDTVGASSGQLGTFDETFDLGTVLQGEVLDGRRQVTDVGEAGREVGAVRGDEAVGRGGQRFEPGECRVDLGCGGADTLREVLDVHRRGLDGRSDRLGRVADAAGSLLERRDDLAESGRGRVYGLPD